MPVEENLMQAILLTFGTAMVPVLELRGAIPVGVAAGLSPAAACLVSILGNMVPVPFILLLIRRIFDWLRGTRLFGPRIDWLERRAHLKGRMVRKYRLPGLIILVAIPLPGTGAWTGALVAALLDIRMRHALPAIFLGTILTHLCGGSAGREGAALQMGGTIGRHAGSLFNLDDRDLRTATMAGMAAFFSALFGTPLTATVFAIVVISIGVVYHVAFIPCLTASLVAYWISVELGVAPTRFSVAAPELEKLMLLRVAVLGVGCALVSVLLCRTLHFAEHQMKKRLLNAWLRVLVGGGAVIALTYLCGTRDYNGAGMDLIPAAVEQGTARPEAFLLKILFTAVTLSAGFKGGEVVPSFFVGATFGCVAGPLLGIPAGFAAALGLAAVFCGATNCPLASIFLSVELFGDGGLLYFALICGISYMLSGYNGLYSSQTIVYSKLKAQYINVRTNAYHAGEPVPPFQQGGGEETERD